MICPEVYRLGLYEPIDPDSPIKFVGDFYMGDEHDLELAELVIERFNNETENDRIGTGC